MRSVLISIRPYWVFLIIAKIMGWSIDKEKTVEVRKNYPKDKRWNKVVKIYCSKDKRSFSKIPKEYQPLMEHFLGKVIGEFVCDTVVVDKTFGHDALFNAAACMTDTEVASYCLNAKMYGWHISNLVIYDRPFELRQFTVEGDCDCLNCRRCFWAEPGNGYNVEDDCGLPYEYMGTGKELKPLFRPPQSWCYVEEVNADAAT